MALKNPAKLEKLAITGYKTRKRANADEVGRFEAMFNPESFKQAYQITYGKGQGLNSTGQRVDYSRSKPTELALELLVDGTGVDQLGIAALAGVKTVAERVKEFVDLTFRMNGEIHEPNYLVVEWGLLIFSCRLGRVEINYTNFDRNGMPLRAALSVTFVADKEVKKRMAEENKSSPDLTHQRLVKAGDTLPLLCKSVYGQAEHYPLVARFNGLDDFRNLAPGQAILFPPLEG